MEADQARYRNHLLSPRMSADEAIAWHLRHAASFRCRAIPEDVIAELHHRAIVLPRGYERHRAAIGSLGGPAAPEVVTAVASAAEALRQSGLWL